MDEDVRRGLAHRGSQRLRVERVAHDRRRTGAADVLGARLRARHSRDLVAGIHELADERPPDGAGRARDEDLHQRAARRSRAVRTRSHPIIAAVTASSTKSSGPSRCGCRERDAECNRERSGVARVVVVANAERADLAEEGPGVDQLVGAEREVADRERHEEDANDIAPANCSLPLHRHLLA